MKTKQAVKKMLSEAAYRLSRVKDKVKGPDLDVMSIDETIDLLLTTDKSVVRFGDGELSVIRGKRAAFQNQDEELRRRLAEILSSKEDNPVVAVMDIFDGLDHFVPASRDFWKDQLFFTRKILKKLCSRDRRYANMSFTRPYITMADRSGCAEQFRRMRSLFAGKRLFVVEGATTHNGVGNDLFSGALSVRRLICPSRGAFSRYREIYTRCLELADREELVLASLGPTAKPLTVDLVREGYRVIDIGNLDTEYEWFLMNAEGKVPVPKQKITGREANLRAGYTRYLEEIAGTVEEA